MASLAPAAPLQSRPQGFADSPKAQPGFTMLEQAVIRDARLDRLWTIGDPSRVRRLWNTLLGRGNPRLASARLEAIREMAVVTWRYGPRTPPVAVQRFLSAGFTSAHHAQLVACVEAARSAGLETRP